MGNYKTFKEAKEELVKSIKKSKKGDKVIHSFSRTDFNALFGAYINDPTHVMETVQIVDGNVTNVKTEVVREFREKFILPILVEYGIAKEEAEKAVNDYKFKNSQVAGIYEFIAEILYQYIDAGKKFNFPNRKDFQGSIHLKAIPSAIVERDLRDIKDHKTIIGHKKEKRDSHKTIVKKSTAPNWLRHVL